jgi:hypothetical protein
VYVSKWKVIQELGVNSHQKVVLLKGVVVHLYTTIVSDVLEEKTADHAAHKTPCSSTDSVPDLGNEKDEEDDSIEHIALEVGHIARVCLIERACLQCAKLIWLYSCVCHFGDMFWSSRVSP